MNEIVRQSIEKTSAVGLVLVGTTTLSACGVANEGRQGYCYSPPAISDRYAGDTEPGVTDNPATYKIGVEADIAVRPSVADREKYKIIASFGDPEPHEAPGSELTNYEWKDTDWRDSLPIDPDHARKLAFAIGRNPVRFAIMIKAANGSPACDVAPTVSFHGPQEFAPLKDKD